MPTGRCWLFCAYDCAALGRGQFYRLYMIEDFFSSKIVGEEVHAEESAYHASALISQACLAEGIRRGQLALHADNGSPMR